MIYFDPARQSRIIGTLPAWRKCFEIIYPYSNLQRTQHRP